jgi:arginine deiminase (EC 3.5.3.6)
LKIIHAFKDSDIPRWFDRDDTTSLEGGDELVLNKEVLAIGISERTDAASIEKNGETYF